MADQKPSKAQLKDAQARHQSALFGSDAQKPTSQQAETQAKERGDSLSQAAAQKQQRLSDDEARKLEELQARNRANRAQVAPSQQPEPAQAPSPQQTPKPKPPAPSDRSVNELRQTTRRSDLAAQAVDNMKQNITRHEQSQARPPRSTASTPPPSQATPAPQGPPQPAPRSQTPPPPRPAPGGKRPVPSPEELDRLLREMARRSAARRAAGGAPPPAGARPSLGGPERPEAAPAPEAPPPPPEVEKAEEQAPEKHAEILKGLRAKEAAAQRDIKPIPQSDQERAEEKPVEATVPIRTEGNAISAAPLHEAIADLQQAMKAHNAASEVEGVNTVQQNMPQHPLYNGSRKDQHGT